jgi:Cu+-exporting ATPase
MKHKEGDMSGCCHAKEGQSAEEEKKAYHLLLMKSTVALVVGAFFFLGPFTGLFPGLSALSGEIFWVVALLVVACTILYSGRDFYLGAYSSFKNHQANMDTLVASGTFAAWLYSGIVIIFHHHIPVIAQGIYFDTACLVIGFVVLGSAMEMKARSQTNAAISQLMALAPSQAVVIRDGKEMVVAVADIQMGDTIRLKPGDKVPVDGQVIDGETYVDESMLTGEPLAVRKNAGSEIFTGTVNQSGAVLFQATRVGADTALANIIETVKKAQRSKPAIGRLTDKIASVFAPLVLILALLTALLWLNWGPPPVMAHVLMTAMAVLLIACPCALGLATPISIMIAVGRAASMGLIVRNGDALQQAARLTTVVLDKTGTITEGRPKVTDICVVDGVDASRLLQMAASIESQSEHPLATAICQKAKEAELGALPVTEFQAVTGQGVKAMVEGVSVLLGNERLLAQAKVDIASLQARKQQLAEQAKTPVYIAVNGQLLGLIAIADPVKSDAEKAIADMQKQGLRVVMLTGDSSATALAVAQSVGIPAEDVLAEVLPETKDQTIADLIAAGDIVAMVGDGINDAAALSRAHLGFAIGSGTDIAIDSADMVLMNGSLQGVVQAMALSRLTMKNIKQNLVGAFGYNVIGIPIAAGILFPWLGILLSPIISGIAMAASSLTVVANANRLRVQRLPNTLEH